MEYLYRLGSGRKVAIHDEGNTIYLIFIETGKNVQWMIVGRDYGYDLCGYYYHEKLFISYVTIGNELVWEEAGKDKRTILYSANSQGTEILNSGIVEINNVLYVFFQVQNLITKEYEIKYICPDGIRKSYSLINNIKQVEYFDFLVMKKLTYIKYKSYGDMDEKIHLISSENNLLHISDEYMFCNKNETNKDSIYIEKLESVEKQYNELVNMTKEIQEEGKKWRELYYKSIKKR